MRTDSNGEFLLAEVASGSQTLVIDGTSAGEGQRQYGRYEYHLDVQAGKLNALPFVIWMSRLDTAHTVQIASPTSGETVLTTPRIPGLELRIPPNKVIRDAAGRIVTQVSITPIPVDQPPFPLPNVPVPIYFTIQPGGAHLEDVAGTGAIGARLIYPNFTSSPPGARMDFWNYDSHDRGWYVYGQGSVSADGRQTIPDPGVAIYEFTGAMIGTGLFLHERVDLRIADVVPIEVRRTYRPRDGATRSFGIGTMLSYDLFLVGDTFPYTYQDLILPDGGHIHYTRTSAGTSFEDAIYKHTGTQSAFSYFRDHGAGYNGGHDAHRRSDARARRRIHRPESRDGHKQPGRNDRRGDRQPARSDRALPRGVPAPRRRPADYHDVQHRSACLSCPASPGRKRCAPWSAWVCGRAPARQPHRHAPRLERLRGA